MNIEEEIELYVKMPPKKVRQISLIIVEKLLKESEDLDPKYSKVVDKYFWELM